VDRVFLDANVLFSAAYIEGSGLARLWQLADAELLSSDYATEEARRNLALDREAAFRQSEWIPVQDRKDVVIKDFYKSDYRSAIAALRGAIDRDLRPNAHLAVVAQVRDTGGQTKVGARGETRRDERLRVVELNVRH
jgi:hypothetical protein